MGDIDPTGKKHVAIAGNIGVGKTALTRVLSDYFKWEAYYEDVEENPYLTDFYDDMERWAFHLQIYFLTNRYRQQKEIEGKPYSVVQDRSLYEDSEIFAQSLYEMDLMSPRDFRNYEKLFASLVSDIEPPDLLVYLRASVPTLVQQIEDRGRPFEQGIRLEYLQRLNERYQRWIESYDRGPKIIIDTDELDFVNSEVGRGEVIQHVEARLFGLFSE